MSLVRLGKISLRWCKNCNIPLIGNRCSICGKEGFRVELTPPGDPRPAFDFDISMIRELVDKQFGEGCGKVLLPDDKVFLLNRAPSEDRLDEIVVDGKVVGALRYDIFKSRFSVILRMEGAVRISECIKKSWAIVDEGAIESILKSSNAMAVGITELSDGIEKGDEVLVLSPERKVIAVGRAMMGSDEMRNANRGVGVKIRSRFKGEGEVLKGGQTWDDVIKANEDTIKKNIGRAVKFIRKSAEKYNLPMVVSYSGGKDSLASLLLALDAGFRPKVMFLNTGIELPETIENAKRTAERYSLDIEIIEAGDAFWHGLKTFGPPAKDYRWCCKACKLGPTTLFIKEHYPNGMLSIIGQRSYESESRARKGEEWENPWVKNQIGISPIQRWSALDVWLYLFYKKAEWNPWYERGMHRIGCYLCPSADLGDAEILKKGFSGYSRWENYLKEYAKEKGLPDEWVKYGLWRWKMAPPWAKSKGMDIRFQREKGIRIERNGNVLSLDPELDMENVRTQISILGEWVEKDGHISVNGVCEIYEDHIEVLNEEKLEEIEKVTMQVANCIGCGVCVGRCPMRSISIKEGRAVVDEKSCAHCMECLKGPCPARDFNPATSRPSNPSSP